MAQRYRDDGWPLCPACDEDELWSKAGIAGPYDPPLPLVEYFQQEFRCYRCNWHGCIEQRYLGARHEPN